jgi:cyclophilin family peptidyl-prolyl cis-trans isomerase
LENQVKELHTVQEQLPILTSKVEQHKKDLASTQQQMQQLKQQNGQLEKDKQQLESEKKQLEQQQEETTGATAATSDTKGEQQPAIGMPGSSSAVINTARLQALAVAGAQCAPVQGYDFWGDPTLIWGYDHRAADAAECCAACHAHRQVVARGGTEQGRNSSSCNLWAFCGHSDKCGSRFGECWLRGAKKLPTPPNLPEGANEAAGWMSGVVYDDDSAHLAAYNNTALVFTTKLGDIHIELLPELAPTSVRELRRAATILAPSGHCSNCRIYRPEKNFLVQGILEAPGVYVATPRNPNPPQRMVMERGLVCWAGGGGGPHWFVNMVNQTGFKDEHLCFGLVKNMTLFEAILELPVKQKQKPSDMNGLVEDIRFNMTLKALDAKQ